MEQLIDVGQAVKIAKEFAEQIYSRDSDRTSLTEVDVEEVEYVVEENMWLITLGWNDPAYKEIPSAEMAGIRSKAPRTNKVFYIDAEKGAVKKMRGKQK